MCAVCFLISSVDKVGVNLLILPVLRWAVRGVAYRYTPEGGGRRAIPHAVRHLAGECVEGGNWASTYRSVVSTPT